MVLRFRSFVRAPMRHGKLFLAGDAAHTVPPTGAKGLNLAFADVRVLFEGLESFYAAPPALLDAYSDRALERVWKAQKFSYWMTSMLHTQPDADAFARARQLGELDAVCLPATARPTSPRPTRAGLPPRGQVHAPGVLPRDGTGRATGTGPRNRPPPSGLTSVHGSHNHHWRRHRRTGPGRDA